MKNIVQIFYGTPGSWFYAVIALVILDYITGVCAAIHSRELSSEIGAKGIAKKITISEVWVKVKKVLKLVTKRKKNDNIF